MHQGPYWGPMDVRRHSTESELCTVVLSTSYLRGIGAHFLGMGVNRTERGV
jgi:hypothetical protein